jgi:hypothetical protein
MGAANTDAHGYRVGSQILNAPCGNMAGDGPHKTHSPIPTGAPTRSTLAPIPPLAVLFADQPDSLSLGGIKLTGTSTQVNNPA